MADDDTPILEIEKGMARPPRVRVTNGFFRGAPASNDYKRIHSVPRPLSKDETDKLIRIQTGVIKGLLESQGHDVSGIEPRIETAIQLNKNVTADSIKTTVIATANQAAAGAGNAQAKLEQSLRAQGLDPRDPLVERALKLYGNLNPSELHNAVERLRRADRGDATVLGNDGFLLRAGGFGDGGSGTSARASGNMTPNYIRYSNGQVLHGSDISPLNYSRSDSPFTATGMTYGTFNNVRTSLERFTSTGRERFNEANVLVGAQDSKRIGLTNNERTIRNIAVIDGADPVAREKIIKGVEAFQKKTQTDPELGNIIRDGVQTYQASKAAQQDQKLTPQQKANAAIAFENAKGRLVGNAIKDGVQSGTAKVIQALPADAQAAAYETAFKDGALAPLAQKLFPNDAAKQKEFVNTWGNLDTTKPEQVKAFKDSIRKEAGNNSEAITAAQNLEKGLDAYVTQRNASIPSTEAAAKALSEEEKLLMGTPSAPVQPADPSTKPAVGQAATAPDAPKPNASATAKLEDIQGIPAPPNPANQGSNGSASGTTPTPAAASAPSTNVGQPAAKEPAAITPAAPTPEAPKAKVDTPAPAEAKPAEAKKTAAVPAPKMN